MRYAKGASALASCDRCGGKMPYRLLVPDGYKPGLRVHPSCRDTAHPQEKPVRTEEGIALKNPRPDRDDDSPGAAVDFSGTARGGTANSIILAADAPFRASDVINATINLTGGFGSGQSGTIIGYNIGTKEAFVSSPWGTGLVDSGTAQAGSADSLTLAADATAKPLSEARLVTGAGSVQERTVSAYDGGTKVATVSPRWRTNLVPRSEELDNASWTKAASTISADATTAPDGTLTADKLQEDNTTAVHRALYQANMANGVQHTISAYLKKAERTWCALNFASYSSGIAWFDLENGVTGTVHANVTATIEAAENGFYRCSITGTPNNDISDVDIFTATGNGVISFAGTTGSGIYVWGVQIEKTSAAGDYIKTEASAITLPDATTTYEVDGPLIPDATTTYSVTVPDTLAEAMGFTNSFGGAT